MYQLPTVLEINDPKKRLAVTTKKMKNDEVLVNVFISGGELEEQLQASIVVKGMRDDLVIPVTAKWGRVKPCPCCNLKSLCWNFNDRQYECLNGKCNARGPTLDNLKGPLCDK